MVSRHSVGYIFYVLKWALWKNSILSSVPWLSRAFCMPCQLEAVSWQLTWLAKLMVYICVGLKPFDGVILAILHYCLSFCMMRIWNCLEVCCTAPTTFTSYFPTLKFMPMKLRTSHCAFALPYCHYIISTNIHLSYDVFLVGHISMLLIALSVLLHRLLFCRVFLFFASAQLLHGCSAADVSSACAGVPPPTHCRRPPSGIRIVRQSLIQPVGLTDRHAVKWRQLQSWCVSLRAGNAVNVLMNSGPIAIVFSIKATIKIQIRLD